MFMTKGVLFFFFLYVRFNTDVSNLGDSTELVTKAVTDGYKKVWKTTPR